MSLAVPFSDEQPEGKSRSQKKRESAAAQQLGASLAALPAAELLSMDLPEDLLAAILDWKQFSGREARRRQMQYIGRLMRDTDLASLEAKLRQARIQNQRQGP